MSKIYTGSGDRGKTSLFSGERVPKDHVRVEAYGEIDELNAVIGSMTASIGRSRPEVTTFLSDVQSDLMEIGAALATTIAENLRVGVADAEIRRLEMEMDRMDAMLPPLRSFILPGGGVAGSWAHIARTVCRRAERRMTALCRSSSDLEQSTAFAQAVVYVNRLSDYFFVLARYLNHLDGVPDIQWMARAK